MNPPPFDAQKAQAAELDLLTGQAVTFRLPKKSLLRFFGKPERTFLLQQPYYGTLNYLCREYIKMQVDEERISADALSEIKHLVVENAVPCARIVAIAVLRDQWKIRLFTRVLTHYILWRIDSKKLLQIAHLILLQANLQDFISSIRLMSAKQRTTMPTLMEQPSPQDSIVPTDD